MSEQQITEILKRPYERILIPDYETNRYTALIKEFPGCVAEGETPSEALDKLHDSASAWILSCVERNIEIPEPNSDMAYSGRIALRISKLLHKRAAEQAKYESVSLNQFISQAISEKVSTDTTIPYLEKHISRTLSRLTDTVNTAREGIQHISYMTANHLPLMGKPTEVSSVSSELYGEAAPLLIYGYTNENRGTR